MVYNILSESTFLNLEKTESNNVYIFNNDIPEGDVITYKDNDLKNIFVLKDILGIK